MTDTVEKVFTPTKDWKPIPRVSRVIPFGYVQNPDDPNWLLPVSGASRSTAGKVGPKSGAARSTKGKVAGVVVYTKAVVDSTAPTMGNNDIKPVRLKKKK